MQPMTLVEALGLADARVIGLSGGGGKTTLLFALADLFAAAGESVLVTTTTRMAIDEVERCPPLLVGEDAVPRAAPTAPGIVVACRDIDRHQGKALGFAPEAIDRMAGSDRFARILVEADGSARRPLKAPLSHEPVFPACCDTVVMVAGLSGVGRPLDEATVFRAAVWAERLGQALGEMVTAEAVAEMAVHPEGLARGAPKAARLVLYLNQADSPERIDAGRRIIAHLAGKTGCRLACAVAGRLLPHPEVGAVRHIH